MLVMVYGGCDEGGDGCGGMHRLKMVDLVGGGVAVEKGKGVVAVGGCEMVAEE
ncbi:hypothetical protein Tco_0592204, partial [Tanacetum coccineum]